MIFTYTIEIESEENHNENFGADVYARMLLDDVFSDALSFRNSLIMKRMAQINDNEKEDQDPLILFSKRRIAAIDAMMEKITLVSKKKD
jgi:hypothetical protein